MMINVDCAIQVEISKCKNRCIFCSPGGVNYPVNMDEKIVSIYNQAISLRKAGLTMVEISGHDPIEFDRITGLVAWLKKIGFEMVAISTHGRNLCDIDFARKLIGCGVDAFRIPLYGSTARVHDSVTLSAGSFDETVQGLHNLNKLKKGLFDIQTMILRQNIDDFKEMVDLFSRLKAAFVMIGMPMISPLKTTTDYYAVSYSELKKSGILTFLLDYCNERLGDNFCFLDYPSCLFGRHDKRIIESDIPNTGQNYEVPVHYRISQRGVPLYRLKQRIKLCEKCTMKSCSGFLKQYLEHFGIDDVAGLKPI